MNSYLITFTILVVASAAHIVPSHHPLPKHSSELYSKSAELYQAGLELQHLGGYTDQSQAYASTARHSSKEGSARILSQQAESDGHGYHYSYETDNGIKAQEQGTYKGKSIAVEGGYSYTGDDGKTYTVTYTADEHGFRPSGEHLPTPPPIPEGVLKGLEQNERDEAAGNYDDGSYKESHQPQDESDLHYEPQYEAYQHHNSEQAHHQQPTTYESHSYQAPVDQHHLPGYLTHTTTEFGHQSHAPSIYGQENHGTSEYQGHVIGYQGHGHDSGFDNQGTGYSSHGNGYQSQEGGHQGLEGLGHHGATVEVSSSVGGGFHYKH